VERNAPEYVKNTRQHKFRVDSTKGEKAVNMYVFATAGLDLGYYELRLNGDELYYTIDQAKENYQRILADIPMLLCINNAHTDSDRLFIHQLMSSILPKPAPWEIPNSFPKYTPLRSNKVAIRGTTGPTNPIKVPRFIRPADQIISQTHRLFESNFPKNNRRVVYQLKNSKETKDSKQTNPSIHTVNFYLPPKYVNTQVNKMRVNPTSINKNKTKLYHHIGQYKASRNLMSIPH
jgi:hypothetical protein